MRFYEVVFIVRADASSSHVGAVTESVIATVKEYGGEITKTEFCGLRYLAYPIKKNKSGHYVLLNVALSQEGVAELERRLTLNEDIIRFLVVRVDVLDNNPSALMRRNTRESRSGDRGRVQQ
ncbi:MAG: 30S ribosomal protein S6 [Holosporales bacterium]|jgi:small subunit ribosomal protein S6|nr:30S ribosomal protein S6 [Holosporales bacterium]